MFLLDCTFRDGGYYNDWDFSPELIERYLVAMQAVGVDVVELGFRSLKNEGFKGSCAYTTDDFLASLSIPQALSIGVMVNANELVGSGRDALHRRLAALFSPAAESRVSVVRIACHIHEFEEALEASNWLSERGYTVGFNIMQVADRSADEIFHLAQMASQHPVDVLYFADSMGSMMSADVANLVEAFRAGWSGELGIHTHDNKGQALANTLAAIEAGVTWVDSTVTGMGRGPGNAQTEYAVLALKPYRERAVNMTPLMSLVRDEFAPLKAHYGWGTNPYYYMAGEYGIHPSYVQAMLGDARYSDADILAVIDHLKREGGKKFNLSTLEAARHFYLGEPRGEWNPASTLEGRTVLILGTGPGVRQHRTALEQYIERHKPYVIALNALETLPNHLIDARAACHPVRLLADCSTHVSLPQPLITPASMLPDDVQEALQGKPLLDFGIQVTPGAFRFASGHADLPQSSVAAYALAVASAGRASRVLMAGFDGYPAGDPRNEEMDDMLAAYRNTEGAAPVLSVTPTRYHMDESSIYALVENHESSF